MILVYCTLITTVIVLPILVFSIGRYCLLRHVRHFVDNAYTAALTATPDTAKATREEWFRRRAIYVEIVHTPIWHWTPKRVRKALRGNR